MKYTKAADAWDHEKAVAELAGHELAEPTVEEFTFVGTRYESHCVRCGKRVLVSGGWGGPASFGPMAHTECPAAGGACHGE